MQRASWIFPPVQGQAWREESAKALIRDIQGWSNYQSAVEEQEALQGLIQEAVDAGFCTIYNSVKQAEVELGRTPLLNKLGVIVKEKESGRKCRIIWDLKESRINSLCHQGERVILPKLTDVPLGGVDSEKPSGAPSNTHLASVWLSGSSVT